MHLMWIMPLCTAIGAGVTFLVIWVVLKIKGDI